MTNKAPSAGWVIQQTILAPLLESPEWRGPARRGPPSFKYFNVALASASKAIEAAAKHLSGTEDAECEMSAVRQLSLGEVAALSLAAGEVKPA
jgi:hypothetical protein